ncbi:glycine--tRNA ligase [bacterium (Candidatus Gribaldobacteria) CG07_land_8_20_14_0_80_33_18]|uniref:glycine--tRNA ligase n=1 Tax=bacterium (Candidatus Gribaldobacteria) CG07_land_8_20_14_0_80_33_18 TaxID=2014272 RepID=A0A2M6Z209_9BACT|nr:MAG: glycine--tRNA ligase [bacterium (Candidatus Gribaldobacteria) CG10_big_fil_rev_8_21_14_0_10_33_41]PIU46440.1 MAG: glycine--tRNA ligase [bacterium (Candidatus Gribaldobacteria) CG07_land_8_20_14_0_80_33_18]PJA00915.1 MAG: glycine--tRNA ligase [bacterium (Candidatus Gribaldobacteria) CG_4_10_14_0_2_um_filter_33_15]PJB08250.1 MAG: glycine--tRNA ligase [bacterium (Candidatus Gribaldobacteria) CG_4_9_14_3_um_filter_33_9]
MDLTEKIISLCKRRGFVFQSSEIYSGLGGIYDFGPLGVELKNNIKKVWWEEMTRKHENIIGLDSAILMNSKVWEASGHLSAGFAEELKECKSCHKRFKLDELQNQTLKCPECKGELTKARKFNLMMKTSIGPVEDKAAITYLRAETCQGIYVNFLNILNSMRLKIPFGVAQIGKAFRNEITPKNFIFKTREFEQMEMQWFTEPETADEWFEYWKNERINWYLNLGIKKENLKTKEVPEKERAHYAKRQVDIEYKFPFGWQEIEGIHNRGDWDLSNHSKFSGQDLSYYDDESKNKYFPYIIETSVGVERSFLAFLCDSYQEIKGGRTKTTKAAKDVEILLKLDKRLVPIKAAILPLVRNKPELVKKAKEVYQMLKPYFTCQYDELGSIGRRYRRQDEIATIASITIDFQTLDDSTVTLRNRDTMEQIRVEISKLKEVISGYVF